MTYWNDRLVRWARDLLDHQGRTRWALNVDGLADALDHLGLEWDVELAIVNPSWMYGALGAYHAGFQTSPFAISDETDIRVREPLHVVSIAPELSPEAASYCLWHELTHALQAERAGTCPWDWWEAHRETYKGIIPGTRAYFEHPIEAEAFANMVCHDTVGPLAVWA